MMTDLTGRTIDRYEILSRLGEGGMAVVYRARDTRLKRFVAIKLIRTEMFPPAILDQMLKRFEREATALAGLSHHNIVTVHDFGKFGDSPYLVMEYLPGGTLRNRMGKPVHFHEASRLLIPIADALGYAHSESIVHRDVKPVNILFAARGEPKLSDFGIARLLEMEDATNLTATGMGIGTPAYMAPEQWEGQVSPAVDIYALGVVLYEMLTGRLPYEATTPAKLIFQMATQPLPDPRTFVPGLPDEAVTVVQTALQRQPEERFESMAAFAAALVAIRGSSPEHTLSQTPVPAPKYPQRSLRHHEILGQADSGPTMPGSTPAGTPGDQSPVEVLPPIDSGATLPTPTPGPADSGSTIGTPTPPSLPSSPASTEGLTAPGRRLAGLSGWLWAMGAAVVLLVGFISYQGWTSYQENQGTKTALAALSTHTPTGEVDAVRASPTITSLPGGRTEAGETPTATATSAPFTATATATPEPTATETPEPSPTPTPGPGDTRESAIDGMVLSFIPAGSFQMGSTSGESDEQPVHTVTLDAFWMDTTDVTNEMFSRFVEQTAYVTSAEEQGWSFYFDGSGWVQKNGAFWKAPGGPGTNIAGKMQHPVVHVSWEDANAYCAWADRRLPTEAEWEYAARGGLAGKLYPWGDEAPVCTRGAFSGAQFGDCSPLGTVPVGSFTRNDFGLYDMVGNVWKWVNDWYGEFPSESVTNPTGPSSGEYHVLRGGSWSGAVNRLRVADRRNGINTTDAYGNIGFRCARSP